MDQPVAQPQITSKKFSLNKQDWMKTLFMGLLSIVAWPVANFLTQQALDYVNANDPQFAPIVASVVTTVLAYIAKQFGTGASQKVALTNTQVDQIQTGPNPEQTTAK